MNAVVSWLEHRQIGLYLVAIAVAGIVGLTVPGAHHLEATIEPVLALLLFATFLGVPFAAIRKSLRDGPFLAAVGVLNFSVVPLVAYGLSRFVAAEPALLFGVLLVLLTPCIDYVIVFAGLAGGASERLLAAAPLLMLAQILLLPLYLLLFIGPEGVAVVATRALVFSGATRNSLVVLPLALALPSSLSLAPVVVVTQTLVELIGMVIFVRLIPRLVPSQGRETRPEPASQPAREASR